MRSPADSDERRGIERRRAEQRGRGRGGGRHRPVPVREAHMVISGHPAWARSFSRYRDVTFSSCALQEERASTGFGAVVADEGGSAFREAQHVLLRGGACRQRGHALLQNQLDTALPGGLDHESLASVPEPGSGPAPCRRRYRRGTAHQRRRATCPPGHRNSPSAFPGKERTFPLPNR